MPEHFPEWKNFAKQQVVVKTADGKTLEGILVSRDFEHGIVLDHGSSDRYYIPLSTLVWIRVKRQDPA